MKTLFSLLSVALFTCTMACNKGKKTDLPTDMRVKVDNDTTFITTDVATTRQSTGVVFIKGTSADGSKSLEIGLTGYAGKKASFLVDYRGPGGNMTGNTGQYRDGISITMARTGRIEITSVADGLIKGNFNFYYAQTEIRGTFTSATP